MKTYITGGDGVPAWSAPISHAVVVGDTCYLSGQLSLDGDGSYVPGSGKEEARRAFDNVESVLRASGFTLQDMVFVDIAFIDLGELADVNAVFAGLFAEGARPARTVYQAAALPYGARIKVAGVAVRGRDTQPGAAPVNPTGGEWS
jgi:2-iminobutanoate/2-iminopropanoate deaminase